MRKLVIIPTYNEKENISKMIDRVFSLPGDIEMLVVDDNSPDGTADIVRERKTEHPGLHLLPRAGKEGLGKAYIAGFGWALERGYDFICEMDCDFSHNPDDLLRLYAEAEEGTDVVVGSRYVKGGKIVNWPFKRWFVSRFGCWFAQLVTWIPVHDVTAGFVCYSRRALESIDLEKIEMKGYGFQVEMKYTAWRLGLKIKEIPIVFTERTEGTPKMSGGIIREAFIGVFKLRRRKISATKKAE